MINNLFPVPQLKTEIPGPQSALLHQRKVAAVSAGVGNVLPAYIVSASDGLLEDVDGNILIDLGSGIGVTGVGNANRKVIEAVTEQVEKFTHTAFAVTPYEVYIDVCETLNKVTPGDFEKRSALFNSGAEAVENAVKIARYFTKRDAIIVLENGYHGRTNLTMAMTAKTMPFRFGFGPFAPEIYRLPFSNPLVDGLSGDDAAKRTIARVDKEIGAESVAAIVFEPVQGEGGFIVPAQGFLQGLSKYAAAHGILMIADEIQSGFCRTGKWFASEHFGLTPDLVITAKGMAGGMPLSAVTGRSEVMDSVHAGGLGGTYTGNPVACAAAIAAVNWMSDNAANELAKKIEDRLKFALNKLKAEFPQIAEVRGMGAMVALEFIDGSGNPLTAEVMQIAKTCHSAGAVVLTAGMYGNVIRFLPPLSIPDHVLESGISIFSDSVKKVLN